MMPTKHSCGGKEEREGGLESALDSNNVLAAEVQNVFMYILSPFLSFIRNVREIYGRMKPGLVKFDMARQQNVGQANRLV